MKFNYCSECGAANPVKLGEALWYCDKCGVGSESFPITVKVQRTVIRSEKHDEVLTETVETKYYIKDGENAR